MPWEALQTLSHTLAWTLLHFLWQGALVGLLYVVGIRAATTVRQRHAAALFGLLVLLALPPTTFYWLHQEGAQAVTTEVAAGSGEAMAAAMTVGADGAIDDTAAGVWWAYLLVFVWLTGALTIALRLLCDWRLLRTAIRTGTTPPSELVAMLERQVRRVGVGRRVRLCLTARITSAGVYGWLRPVILLPTALALCMPRDQLETLLAHELAHIRRADFLANSMALLARTLLYFHPVVHRLCGDLERTREQLCDDLVVSLDIDRIKYARALSTAESFRQRMQVPVPLLTATGGELSERVHRILEIRPSTHSGRERAPILLSLTAIVVAVIGLNGTDSARLLSVTRPEFLAAYATLMTSQAPAIAAADIVVAPPRPRLPGFATPETIQASETGASSQRMLAEVDDIAETVEPEATSAPTNAAEQPPVLASTATEPQPMAPPQSTPEAMPAPIAATIEPGTTADMSEPVAPRVVRRISPTYPSNARWNGVEGSVTLAYRIGADGVPSDIRVVSATPSDLFEQSTIDALRRWRFASGADGEYQQSFDFLLGESNQRCEARVGTRICRVPVRD